MLNIGSIDFSQFHFIRPEWLWSLAVFVLLWLLLDRTNESTNWESFIAKDKLEALRVTGGRASKIWKWLLILGWTLGTLAAAGPTWKQVPVPTVRDDSAMVILLDLSRSMLAEDISPDRLTRAKFKLIDILRQRGDGQTALVAYAGEPHTVSPLTDDPRTIEALLPALHPNIMPVQGSNTEAAIDLSLQLLKDAGVSQGEILLLTDGVASDAQRYIRDLYDGSFRLSILGIGSTEAVPIPRETGGFFTDSRGEIILTKLNRDELQILAGLCSGRYVEMQPDDADIKYLLEDNFEIADGSEDGGEGAGNALLYDSWEDMGYWLVLLLLPFVAYSFRKGAIYLFPLMFILPNQSEAQSWDTLAFGWDDLWLNKDQQAANMLAENPAGAAETFTREDWAAVADFNAQNYESSVERFSEFEDIENTYNLGNALAFNGDLQGALDAYNQVLEQQPTHEDAAHNKAVIEQLMQQQDQQQEDSSESGENSEDPSQDQQGQDQQNQGQEQENQESRDQQNNQQQGSQGQESEQSDSEQQGQQSETGQDESQQQQDQASQSEQENDQQNQSEQQSAQASEQDQETRESEQEQAAMMAAEPTPDALEDSSEQWLRAIPDDPSGLLRRKFDYQSRQNKLEQRYRLQVPSNPDDERY